MALDISAEHASGSHGGDNLLDRLSVLEKKPTLDQGLLQPGWTTLRQLGSGSHGRCYLMKRPDGSLIVHKRVPVSHMLAAHQEVAEREVNILAAFSHPFIIKYDRAFVRQGQLCIAMEHAGGGDLSAHLRKMSDRGERVDLATCLDWFVQLLLALRYVHGYRVLHRDVALKNVFLAEDGTVKLGDFGVARILASTQDLALTKVGTPCYIAPERCEGKPYSYEADIWALGCLLYELLTGRPAFSAETIPAVSAQILSGSFAPFTSADDEHIPPEVRDLIQSLLSVQPEQRPNIDALLASPLLEPYVYRHAAVRDTYTPERHGKIENVEIPLIGYEGSAKTKFSERPVFVDGGGRIVDEASLSKHDEKLLGARNRRQRQLAEKRGSSGATTLAAGALGMGGVGVVSGGPAAAHGTATPAAGDQSSSLPTTADKDKAKDPLASSFDKPMNFGQGGVVGFLVQSAAASSTGGSGTRAHGRNGSSSPSTVVGSAPGSAPGAAATHGAATGSGVSVTSARRRSKEAAALDGPEA